MDLLLRLALAPLMYLTVTAVAARLGPGVGGALAGLPLTTAPFLVVVCLTDGRAAAGAAATGVVAGQLAVVLFCAGFPLLAHRLTPGAASALVLVVASVPVGLAGPRLGLWPSAAVVWAAIAVVLARHAGGVVPASAPGRPGGSVAARAAATGMLVFATSAAIPVVGASLAGVFSAAPVLLSLLLPTIHTDLGAAAARAMARATVVSMTGTVAFAATLGATLATRGPVVAFPLASVALVLLAGCAHGLQHVMLSRGAAPSAPGRPSSSRPARSGAR